MALLHRSQHTQHSWNRFVDGLDDRIASAAERLIATKNLSTAALVEAFRELSKFRTPGGADPNYDCPGLAVAYLLHNQGMRTAAMAVAMSALDRSRLSRIPDIGSGLDATALAIELATDSEGVEYVGVEPSVPHQK
jgi:hypothetical protein